jgi:hypothetical protein
MKKVYIPILGVIGTTFLLTSCVSTNVKAFNPDTVAAYKLQHAGDSKISVTSFSMDKDDKNKISCRMGGNIYLPNAMTYSQYIKNAFEKTLIVANRFSEKSTANHTIAAKITDVDFDSMEGHWDISALIIIDNKNPIEIHSQADFGTSWDAYSACNNATDSFSSAVQKFVDQTLSNPQIKKELA